MGDVFFGSKKKSKTPFSPQKNVHLKKQKSYERGVYFFRSKKK